MGDDPSDFAAGGGKGGGKRANPNVAKEALERLAAITAAAADGGAVEPGEVVRLDLSQVQLYPEGAEQLASAMAGDSACPVQALILCNARLGNAGALEIVKLVEAGRPPLLELDLQMNRMGDAAAQRIGTALRANLTLTTLHLSSNNFHAAAVACIASALEVNAVLRHLSLDYSQMGDEGAECLAAALKKNSALRTLLMRSGEVQTRGAISIAGALEQNTSLEALDISTNEIGDEGAEALASALGGNRTVVRLDMFGCEVSPRSEAAVRAAVNRNIEAAEGAAPVVTDM